MRRGPLAFRLVSLVFGLAACASEPVEDTAEASASVSTETSGVSDSAPRVPAVFEEAQLAGPLSVTERQPVIIRLVESAGAWNIVASSDELGAPEASRMLADLALSKPNFVEFRWETIPTRQGALVGQHAISLEQSGTAKKLEIVIDVAAP